MSLKGHLLRLLGLGAEKRREPQQKMVIHFYRCKLCGMTMTRSRRFYHINFEHGIPKKKKFWKYFEKLV